MKNCILLRYGEVGLKSKRTRGFFEQKYILAIKQALERHHLSYEYIENMGGRFILYMKNTDEGVKVLKNVPGIQSLSEAKSFEFKTKKTLIKKVTEEFKTQVSKKKYYVRVKRVGKHDFKSMDLTQEIAGKLFPFSGGVNLKKPDITVSVEIRDNLCFMFKNSKEGMGGLPPGTAGKVLCLFSGGIDSPLAVYEMLKKGCYVDFLFVNIVDEKVFGEIANIYNYLITKYSYIYRPKMYVVDGKEVVKKIKSDVPDNLKQIAYKIALYKISERILDKHDYDGVVTGESISQKSSQTIKSLSFIKDYSNIFVLRPLLTFDKKEIIRIANEIGTLSASEKIKEYCGLSEGPVTTAPRFEDKKKIVNFDKEIAAAISKLKTYSGVIDVEISEEEELNKIDSSKKLITVDLRSEEVQNNNPIKTDLKANFDDEKTFFKNFKKEHSYLLICKFGVCSETAASSLRKSGVKAMGTSAKNYLKLKELKKI